MTYIEFFSPVAIENICTCLTDTPGRVVLVGADGRMMEKHAKNYDRVFKDRGENIEIICRTVKKYDLADGIKVLQDITDTYSDCVFDITGGDEILNLAMGIVFEKSGRKLQIHKFNLRNGDIFDCDFDGKTVYRDTPKVSIRENMIIYGGDIKFGHGDNATNFWDMTPEFAEDIKNIWTVSRDHNEVWNNLITLLNTVESAGFCDGVFTTARRDEVDRRLGTLKEFTHEKRLAVNALINCGLLLAFEYNEREIVVGYKSEQVKKCLLRAGLALEMKVFVTLSNLTEKNGDLMYNDVMNGVVIDWDGKFHDETFSPSMVDTENEIDIMAMHGVVPIFISCKNGNFNVDELFKLNSIAERFGGKYARKVLVASKMPDGIAGEHLRNRMGDMKIHLIENFHKCSDRKFEEKFEKLWIK